MIFNVCIYIYHATIDIHRIFHEPQQHSFFTEKHPPRRPICLSANRRDRPRLARIGDRPAMSQEVIGVSQTHLLLGDGGLQLGKWGYPNRSLVGFCERENPNRKWMMTGGSPRQKETSMNHIKKELEWVLTLGILAKPMIMIYQSIGSMGL